MFEAGGTREGIFSRTCIDRSLKILFPGMAQMGGDTRPSRTASADGLTAPSSSRWPSAVFKVS